MDGCRDCNRTESLRRAVAEAGRGLPGIEPGMPLPAGTGLTRRGVVSRAAGLALGALPGRRLVVLLAAPDARAVAGRRPAVHGGQPPALAPGGGVDRDAA